MLLIKIEAAHKALVSSYLNMGGVSIPTVGSPVPLTPVRIIKIRSLFWTIYGIT